VRKAPAQFVDEGLAQQVLLLCERMQHSRAALAMLRVLERSLASFPVAPTGAGERRRPTTATGVRVPQATTYLTAIQACASAPPCVLRRA